MGRCWTAVQYQPLSSNICRGGDPQATTPFSIGCQKMGFQEIGGKLDDIAVSCTYTACMILCLLCFDSKADTWC